MSVARHVVDGRQVECKYAVPRKKTEEITSSNDDFLFLRGVLDDDDADQAGAHHHHHAGPPPPMQQGGGGFANNYRSESPATSSALRSMSPQGLGAEIIMNKIFVGGLRYATDQEGGEGMIFPSKLTKTKAFENILSSLGKLSPRKLFSIGIRKKAEDLDS